jgi:nuclear GTP-binding protein
LANFSKFCFSDLGFALDLIDCPGIVPAAKQDTPEELLLRGVVRVENVEYPEQYIPTLLSRVKQHHLERTYNLQGGWTDHIHLLEQLARKGGRLLPGGEPDVGAVAKMVINDFLRGKLPWYIPPPPTSRGGEGAAGNTGSCSERAAEECKEEDDSATDTPAEESAEEIFEGFSPSA